MDSQSSEILEKIRQQFETAPYPRTPLEKSPLGDAKFLNIHNIVNPYYLRNQKVIGTQGKVILDAGCGSGYKALALAAANPGAKIIGIDISEESVKLAHHRLQYHGFENAEFYTLTIENLPSLGIQFDYINNDEVLYLLPDPVAGLQAMKSALKPDGIIRTNLHSALQRSNYYRAQKFFQIMGFMDDNPQQLEIELVRETMHSLKDSTHLKVQAWHPEFERNDERLLANLLLQGDKGYTIPEVFSALRAADLEFISMVNWRYWDLMDLFKEPDNLPAFLAISLPGLSVEEQLHLFELLHPVHRLIDFWCGHPNSADPFVPVNQWTLADWQTAKVSLHPQLRTPRFTEDMLFSIINQRPLEISQHLPITKDPIFLIDSAIATSLLPLLDGPQMMMSLVERCKQLRPIHPVTLNPVDEATAWSTLIEPLTSLEEIGYILLERSPDKA
ncbi:class I SAM-dependent methyltransferase [Aerosakkonema sp. BLCC-F183]|uniref:class I SAM-dependent methyltransferase n=1 Tax=Aerosakkonema sp. BLCC-F183 TaxID=3342834 RepID=UPI0035B95D13